MTNTEDIYQQPASAMDAGDDQPDGTIYIGGSAIAAYLTDHAPDVALADVERILDSGWRKDDTVADAIDYAIGVVRDQA